MTATTQTDQAMYELIARAEFSMRHSVATCETASPFDCLTLQERHILLLVSEGETNSAIAAKMFLSPGTVRNYVSNILRELQCANRAQAASYAVKFQLENYIKGK